MLYLAVKNWDRHQKKVKPEHRKEFIALHLAVLDDPEFQSLPQSGQVLLIQLWLLRGRLGTNIPMNLEYIQRYCSKVCEDDLHWLIEDGWLIGTDEKHPPKSKAHTARKGYGRASYTDDFEDWWKHYPKKLSKADAFRAWLQVEESRPELKVLIAKTKKYAEAMAGNDKYTKFPAGWLRDKRWEDGNLKTRKAPKEVRVNKILDQEQIDHYAHPLWKEYVGLVIAGEVTPGFEAYIESK